MLEFQNHCAELGLRWSIAYGTLLGAVRHKGFIPWDDDVDVLMPQEDYEKFLASPIDDNFALTIEPTGDCPWLFAKVCSRRTVWNEPYTRHNGRLGVFIDIFPWDGVKLDSAKVSFRKAQTRSKLFSYAYSCDFSCSRYNGMKAVIQRMLGCAGRARSPEAHRASISEAIREGKGDDGLVNFYSPYAFEKELVPIADCVGTSCIEFEGCSFPCIGDPEKHLRRIYGKDWMTPVKHDEHIHGIAFWKDRYEH